MSEFWSSMYISESIKWMLDNVFSGDSTDDSTVKPDILGNHVQTLIYLIHITEIELKNIAMYLKADNSKFSFFSIKKFEVIKEPLLFLVKKSLESGEFLTVLKYSKIILIYRNKIDKNEKNNIHRHAKSVWKNI